MKVVLAAILLPVVKYLRMLLIVVPFLAGQAGAAVFCTTGVNTVLIYDTGDLWIIGTASGGAPYGGYQRLCNLNGTSGNMSPITCAAWLSLAKTAQSATNITTQTFYANLNACTDIPGASFPFPVFLINVK